MIKGVKFASIPVGNQDRALAFYTEKLEFVCLRINHSATSSVGSSSASPARTRGSSWLNSAKAFSPAAR
jgi:hypothetical protein